MAAKHNVLAENFSSQHANVKLQSIALVGSKAAYDDIYHWRFYARLDGAQNSVLFNMSPAAAPKGVLVVESKAGLTTRSLSGLDQTIPLQVSKTPSEFLQFIIDHHFERYQFTDDGTGCRFWCLTVIQALEDDHWVAAGVTKGIEGWLDQKSQELGVVSIPQPPPKGHFYW